MPIDTCRNKCVCYKRYRDPFSSLACSVKETQNFSKSAIYILSDRVKKPIIVIWSHVDLMKVSHRLINMYVDEDSGFGGKNIILKSVRLITIFHLYTSCSPLAFTSPVKKERSLRNSPVTPRIHRSIDTTWTLQKSKYVAAIGSTCDMFEMFTNLDFVVK